MTSLASHVQVWLLRTDPEPEPGLADRWWSLLDEDDRARATRLMRPVDGERSTLAHAFLRLCLSRYADVAPEAWRFRRDEHGRPWIATPAVEGLFFSLSHSRGLTAVLVSDHPCCGVDVERLDAARDPALVAKRVFAPAEMAALFATAGTEHRRFFTARWTLKEAWSKARGLGLELPVEKALFEEDGAGVRVSFLEGIDNPREWSFELFEPTEEHVLAVAMGGGVVREVVVMPCGLGRGVR